MKHLPRLFLVTLMAFFFHGSIAQEQFAGWAASFNTIKVSDRFSVHFDGQFRSSSKIKHLQTLLLRPGVNMRLRKNMLASAGYGFIGGRRTASGVTGHLAEHRFWQQFILSHAAGKLGTSHRFRLEQRLVPVAGVENNELVATRRIYANRFRYFIRNILPLQKEQSFSEGIFLALQNEVFLNFGNTDGVNGGTFDQNRLYLATGYRLNRSMDLEIGYMNQYVQGRSGSFTNNHILQVASYLRIP